MPYDGSTPYNSPLAYDIGSSTTIALKGIPSGELFGPQGTVSAVWDDPIVTWDSLTDVWDETVGPGSVGISIFSSGGVSIAINGIASSEAFSLISVTPLDIINLLGIPSQEFFANIQVTLPIIISSYGVFSAEAFGGITTSFSVPQISLIQDKTGPTSSTSASLAMNQGLSFGNFIIVLLLNGDPVTITSLTDTAGNFYTNSITQTNTGNLQMVSIWYAPVTQTGIGANTIHATYNTSGNGTIAVFEFAGIAGPDVPAVASSDGHSGTAVSSTPMISTTNPRDLIIGVGITNSPIIGYEAGWTAVGPASTKSGFEFLIASSIGSYAATFTATTSTGYTAAVASFSPVLQSTPIIMGRIL